MLRRRSNSRPIVTWAHPTTEMISKSARLLGPAPSNCGARAFTLVARLETPIGGTLGLGAAMFVLPLRSLLKWHN
jgi:hypothetical protein